MVGDFTTVSGDKTRENVKHLCPKEEREIYGISDSSIPGAGGRWEKSSVLACQAGQLPLHGLLPPLPPQTPCPVGNVSWGLEAIKFSLLSHHSLSCCPWWRWTTSRPAVSLSHRPRPWQRPSSSLTCPRLSELGPGHGANFWETDSLSGSGHASTWKPRMG